MIKKIIKICIYCISIMFVLTVTSCNLLFSMLDSDGNFKLLVTPKDATILSTEKMQFHAYKVYDNGNREEVTSNIIWKSSNDTKVEINSSGLAVPVSNEKVSVAISAELNELYDNSMLTIIQCSPTSDPTAEPTMEPTPDPTAEPTMEPTAEPTCEPTPVENYVQNPGFECGTDDWNAQNANTSTDEKYEGCISLFLNQPGSKVSQDIAGLNSCSSYVLKVWVKCIDVSAKFHIKVTNCTSGDIVNTYDGNTSWEERSIPFSPIDTNVTIEFQHVQSGIYFDNVSIQIQ